MDINHYKKKINLLDTLYKKWVMIIIINNILYNKKY